MRTFARAFAITFGIALGLLAAGAVAFAGYSIYRADQARRAEEQAQATATAVAQQRATAAAAQAQAQQAAVSSRATAEADKLARRRCEDPNKVVVSVKLQPGLDPFTGTPQNYSAVGTVRNTCNYDIDFRIEFTALAANGSTVIATKTIAINERGDQDTGTQSVTHIRPGEERRFGFYMVAAQPDVGSVRAVPIIVREGDPP